MKACSSLNYEYNIDVKTEERYTLWIYCVLFLVFQATSRFPHTAEQGRSREQSFMTRQLETYLWKVWQNSHCGFILMLMSQMSNTYWCRHKWTPPLVGADIRHTEDLEPGQRFEEMFNNCFSDLFAGECLTCPAHSASPVLKGPWTTATSSFTSHCAVWRVNRRVAQLGPVIDFHWLKFTNRSGTIQIICA